uniref:Uncharacterized protein n=1 Tax=Kalanchoe fedtschenkoi TaxID=63787 RepID=A0A7N1A0I5_KALFE
MHTGQFTYAKDVDAVSFPLASLLKLKSVCFFPLVKFQLEGLRSAWVYGNWMGNNIAYPNSGG